MDNVGELKSLAEYGIGTILSLAFLILTFAALLSVRRRGTAKGNAPAEDAIAPMADAVKSVAEALTHNNDRVIPVLAAIPQTFAVIQQSNAEQHQTFLEQSITATRLLQELQAAFRTLESGLTANTLAMEKSNQGIQQMTQQTNENLVRISDKIDELGKTIQTAMLVKQELSDEDRTLLREVLTEMRTLRATLEKQPAESADTTDTKPEAVVPAPETIDQPLDMTATGG